MILKTQDEINKFLRGEENSGGGKSDVAITSDKDSLDLPNGGRTSVHQQIANADDKVMSETSVVNGGEGSKETSESISAAISPSPAPEDEDSNGSTVNPLDENEGQFKRLDWLNNGAEVLAFFDDDIREGRKKLHGWQIEVNEDIASYPASINDPLQYCLCAANGSGKDAYVIAATAIYFALRFIKSNIVITSASGVQLTAQTETYIRNLAEKVNQKFGMPYFKINQRNIRCRYSGSVIRMFATDEPGKAEGYHPFPDSPDGKCVLILNECKSIPEEIIDATKRCTPTHLLYISSAGEPRGAFYWAYTNWPQKYVRRITSYDCPHKSTRIIEQDKLEKGEHSAWFRSKHLSLFTTIEGQVVISDDALAKCKRLCTNWRYRHWPKRVGMDLAAGGDECSIRITQGNKIIKKKDFVERDTTKSADIIDKFLKECEISKDSEFIFADDGGVGRGIIDNLKRMGWNIKRVLNQWSAWNKQDFGNQGAEMWFNVARIIEEGQWFFDEETLKDEKFLSQLVCRHYRKGEKDKTFLRKKEEEKAEGFHSPDRADAFILSLRGLKLKDFLVEGYQKQVEGDSTQPSQGMAAGNNLTQEQLVEMMHQEQKFRNLDAGTGGDHHTYYNEHILEGTRFRNPRAELSNRARNSRLSSYSLDVCLGD